MSTDASKIREACYDFERQRRTVLPVGFIDFCETLVEIVESAAGKPVVEIDVPIALQIWTAAHEDPVLARLRRLAGHTTSEASQGLT